jgi:2-desacetyl-2-hydroxyethyl bacteriochlorophyllide A dehydrogenase
MKALVYVAPERMEVQDLPEPTPGEGEVLLQVSAAGICGSDIHGFTGHSARRQPGLVMGHETVATIRAVHPRATGWRVGQRVCFNPLVGCDACAMCRADKPNLCAQWRIFGMDRLHGTFAEYVAVPAGQLHALPESLPEAEAIFAEPIAVMVHAFRVAFDSVPATLAIVGGGTMGALALVMAKLHGVPRVCVVDQNEARLLTARTLGADLVINNAREDAVRAVRSWAGGLGAEHVVEAVGAQATRRAAVAMSAKGARLLFLGLAEAESSLPWVDMVRNEQSVFTSFAYAPRDFAASVALIESRRLDLKPWTEARPLEQGQAAFVRMARDPGPVLKMMLKVTPSRSEP